MMNRRGYRQCRVVVVRSLLMGIIVWLIVTTILMSASKEDSLVAESKVAKTYDKGYITLCTDDKFLDLAMVWAYSIQKSGSPYPKIVIATGNLTQEGRQKLIKLGCEVVNATVIPKPPAPRGYGDRTFRADREQVFTKLWIWNMTRYDRLIYMDSDTMVLQNIDHLLTEIDVPKEKIAAVYFCDFGCDCVTNFNSGLMVIRPSASFFSQLLQGFTELYWGGQGDQSYLNAFFRKRSDSVIPLHHTYNIGKNVARCEFEQLWFPETFKVFHFAGNDMTHPTYVSWEDVSKFDDGVFKRESLAQLQKMKPRGQMALLGMQKEWHRLRREMHQYLLSKE